MAAQTVVFVHGLGEGPNAWDAQVAALPPKFVPLVVDVFGDPDPSGPAPSDDALAASAGTAVRATEFTLERAATRVAEAMNRAGVERAHVCGMSLGAMIALQFAIDHPQRVRSLVLAAGQVRPPRALMAAQSAVMRLLPQRVFERQGANKHVLLAALRAASEADFTARLGSLAAPTLVLCGSRDRANLPASRQLARGIPAAQLRVLAGAGHQSHIDAPEEFSRELAAFLTSATPNGPLHA